MGDYDELRAAAEAAMRGPCYRLMDEVDPTTVFALLDEVAALRARAEKAEAATAEMRTKAPAPFGHLSKADECQFDEPGDVASMSLEQLRAMISSQSKAIWDLNVALVEMTKRAEKAEASCEFMAGHQADLAHERDEARAERDALKRHYDAAAPEHNLLALLDLYESRCDARPDITPEEARGSLKFIGALGMAVNPNTEDGDTPAKAATRAVYRALRAHAERAGKGGER